MISGAGSGHARLNHLVKALLGTDVVVFYQDADLRYIWIENSPYGWSTEQIAGKVESDVLPEPAALKAGMAKQEALDTGEPQRIELEVQSDDGERFFDLWIEPEFDKQGNPQGVLCTSVEITENKRRERQLREMVMEVSHRSRNLLAIIQSISNQTARANESLSEFTFRFHHRLQSLAHSLDAVTLNNWQGVALHDLAMRQTKSFLKSSGELNIYGENPLLNPNAALHVGLAFQELSANAAACGAWTGRDGTVDIVVSTQRSESGSTKLQLEWKEHAPGREIIFATDRFAPVTLLSVVPNSLSGSARMETVDNILIYTLDIPTANIH